MSAAFLKEKHRSGRSCTDAALPLTRQVVAGSGVRGQGSGVGIPVSQVKFKTDQHPKLLNLPLMLLLKTVFNEGKEKCDYRHTVAGHLTTVT